MSTSPSLYVPWKVQDTMTSGHSSGVLQHRKFGQATNLPSLSVLKLRDYLTYRHLQVSVCLPFFIVIVTVYGVTHHYYSLSNLYRASLFSRCLYAMILTLSALLQTQTWSPAFPEEETEL